MRISTEPSDSGYRRDTRNVTITLDGDPVEHVITADEELGFVLFYPTDEDGDFIVCNGDQFVRQMNYGKVVISEG